MALQSVASQATSMVTQSRLPGALGEALQINPDASTIELLEAAECFGESAREVLLSIAMAPQDGDLAANFPAVQGLAFAAKHLSDLTTALASEAAARLCRSQARQGGLSR